MMLHPYIRARIDRLKVTGVTKRGDGVLILCPRLAWAARLTEFECIEIRNLDRRSRLLVPVLFGREREVRLTGSGVASFRLGDALRITAFSWRPNGEGHAATLVEVGRRNAPIAIRERAARHVALDPGIVPIPPRAETLLPLPTVEPAGAYI